ncbi:MAG: chemotaxis protein CheX [Proteobacteria bacterium]|nr:chemotaxis protein CheX [Pseudomonadota bacterium]MBU1737720.1 chemotaxis protein CheX [Pseudomonadota bacterium]
MNDDLRQMVYQSLADVFGIMFYIPIEPLADQPPREMWESEKHYVEARIAINCGDGSSFQAMFFFPEDLARNIAINFMGIDEEAVDEEKVIDAVREAANMAVGGLLGKIDPEAKCQLGIPSATMSTGFSPGGLLDAPGACVYETEFGYLWIDFGNLDRIG